MKTFYSYVPTVSQGGSARFTFPAKEGVNYYLTPTLEPTPTPYPSPVPPP